MLEKLIDELQRYNGLVSKAQTLDEVLDLLDIRTAIISEIMKVDLKQTEHLAKHADRISLVIRETEKLNGQLLNRLETEANKIRQESANSNNARLKLSKYKTRLIDL